MVMTISKTQGALAGFLIVVLGAVMQWGLARLLDNPPLAAEGRNELFADSDYSKQIKALEKKRKKIGDRQFYKEKARLDAIRNYRVEAGKNTSSQVCQISSDKDGDSILWEIPSV